MNNQKHTNVAKLTDISLILKESDKIKLKEMEERIRIKEKYEYLAN